MNEVSGRLLIVEDEPITRKQLASHFEMAGFHVDAVADAESVDFQQARARFDICLIDINLPGKDGLTLTKELRGLCDVGIILVTGKDEQLDRLEGLDSGADDYVTKPFDPRELISRTRNLLRRVRAQAADKAKSHLRHFEGWVLDLNKRELTTPGNDVQALSAGEFHLLLALVENAGEVMTRDRLMNIIRNREWYPDDRYIDVLVGQVRRKFRAYSPDTTFISTIHGLGYLFAPTVTV